MLNLPNLLLGIVISILIGAIFHIIRGGNFGRLLLYLFLSWVGFWAGHFLADQTGLIFAKVGTLHLGMAIFGALLLLITGHWFFLSGRPET